MRQRPDQRLRARILLTVSSLLLLALPAAAQDVTGDWFGTLGANRLVLHVLTRVFDAVFYIDRMTPATTVAGDSMEGH